MSNQRIDISRVGLYILSRKGYINATNMMYLSDIGMRFPQQLTVLTPDAELVRARNWAYQAIVSKHVRAHRFDWFLFMDHDNYFLRRLSDRFFDESEADVVGCEYDFDHKESWVRPDEFHMGCVRVHHRVLSKLELPLWGTTYNETKTELVDCDCGYFRRKLLAIGAKIERRGKCGHDKHKSWFCR